MAAKFVSKKGSTGKFRFNLVAGNGEITATSEAYESKASAQEGHRGGTQGGSERDRRGSDHGLKVVEALDH